MEKYLKITSSNRRQKGSDENKESRNNPYQFYKNS